MTPKQCENRRHPHNQRTAFKWGILCRDCRSVIMKGTETYRRFELASDLGVTVHNIGANLIRLGKPYPRQIREISADLLKVSHARKSANRERVLNRAIRLTSKYGKTPEWAKITIGAP